MKKILLHLIILEVNKILNKLNYCFIIVKVIDRLFYGILEL
jgi:hypothetical protein